MSWQILFVTASKSTEPHAAERTIARGHALGQTVATFGCGGHFGMAVRDLVNCISGPPQTITPHHIASMANTPRPSDHPSA